MNHILHNICKIKLLKCAPTIRKPKIPNLHSIYLFIFADEIPFKSKELMRRPEIVQRIAEAIKRVAPDAKTILYGSEARGDARPDSDIDLLILVENETGITLDERMQLIAPLYDIELETGVQINPYIESSKKWGSRFTPFYENVMREGLAL